VTAQFLTGPAILRDGAWRQGLGILIDHGTIRAILPAGETPAAEKVVLPPDWLLAPGLIDIQVNGGGGVLFNDLPAAAVAQEIAAAHRKLGTTSILPTLITDTLPAMQQAARAALRAVTPQSGVIGIHFEGPFLSPLRPGVHRRDLIRRPSDDDLVLLEALAGELPGPVLVTLAPEMMADATLDRLAAVGVILSAGHSAAGYARMEAALAHGVRGFTHLFNAMQAPAARDPGIVAAALLHGPSFCGVIMDGIHVHTPMLRLLLRAKAADRIILVSDAMPPVGTKATDFMVQGRRIFRREGRLTTQDGTLAGADICLADAVRFAVGLGVPSAVAVEMASTVPASFLGIGHKLGRIAPGLRADLLLLNQGLEVVGTWLAGAWEGEWSGVAEGLWA
jgi:N-acetylglucosamine-6-phosphate deacetylase